MGPRGSTSAARQRGGFTVVELMVVAVLGVVIVGAAYNLLIQLRRGYTVQNVRIANAQTIRTALDLLTIELRQASGDGGDVIGMGEDTVSIRAMNALAIACDTATSVSPVVTARTMGTSISTDSVFVFRDGDPETGADDQWRAFEVSSVTPSATCASGDPAQRVTLSGMTAADTIKPGAALRTFERLAYGVYEIAGERYLARRAPSGTLEALVGPFDGSSDDLSLSYVDAYGNPASAPDDVAQIQILARLGSEVTTLSGEPVKDSVSVRVNLRN